MEEIRNKMNEYGSKGIPFLFVFDFLCQKPLIYKLDEINPSEIKYSIEGKANYFPPTNTERLEFAVEAVDKKRYLGAFEYIIEHIRHGDSFLLNLTMPSKIESNFSLLDIFYASKAKYKLWLKDEFVVFSPEIFVKTYNNTISSFPMKGTMDAKIENAREKLLSNKKELAEHYTIVDLIRNDLSMVSKNVRVEKFRYIDHLKTNRGELLQMSSEIKGDLKQHWQREIGDIVTKMLPAGSISGAPKKKTVEIILEAEKYNRGYYTGIFGIFDGENIDSGVMIRFVEKTKEGLVYKSGGGITSQSNAEEEYKELMQKVYVPI